MKICDNLVMASLITASLSCSGTALSGHAVRKKTGLRSHKFYIYSTIEKTFVLFDFVSQTIC